MDVRKNVFQHMMFLCDVMAVGCATCQDFFCINQCFMCMWFVLFSNGHAPSYIIRTISGNNRRKERKTKRILFACYSSPQMECKFNSFLINMAVKSKSLEHVWGYIYLMINEIMGQFDFSFFDCEWRKPLENKIENYKLWQHTLWHILKKVIPNHSIQHHSWYQWKALNE